MFYGIAKQLNKVIESFSFPLVVIMRFPFFMPCSTFVIFNIPTLVSHCDFDFFKR